MNITGYLKLCRPVQWLKNLMLFFPPFLGGTLFKSDTAVLGIMPFIAFGFASSATYIFNDIQDRTNDANHPIKRQRPLAAGTVSVTAAYLLCVSCLLCALVLGYLVSLPFSTLLCSYILIQFSYTLWLKNVAILDIFCIAAGFVLRLQAGGLAFGITISSWLFLSVFLLALFLSSGKRLGESLSLGQLAVEHRRSLIGYPPGTLEGVMYLTGSSVLVTYTMFVISRQTLVYSVPLCFFGILRYFFRVKSGHSGDPTEALTKDGVLFVTGLVWAFMIWYAYYCKP